jgi:hypothetical protein
VVLHFLKSHQAEGPEKAAKTRWRSRANLYRDGKPPRLSTTLDGFDWGNAHEGLCCAMGYRVAVAVHQRALPTPYSFRTITNPQPRVSHPSIPPIRLPQRTPQLRNLPQRRISPTPPRLINTPKHLIAQQARNLLLRNMQQIH